MRQPLFKTIGDNSSQAPLVKLLYIAWPEKNPAIINI